MHPTTSDNNHRSDVRGVVSAHVAPGVAAKKPRIGRRLGRALRIVLSVAMVVLLVLFARTVHWSATWESIRSASPWLLAGALLLNLVSLAVKGVRWWVFLRPVGVPSLSLAVRATFAGAGLNNVLIANGGEAAQVIFVARTTRVSNPKILATVALDRLAGFMGYVLILVLGMWLLPLPDAISRLRSIAVVALVALTAFIVFLSRRDPGEERPAKAGRRFPRFRAYVRRFLHTLSHLATGPRFAAALVLSIGYWGLQIITYQMTAMAVHFPITFTGTVAAVIVVNAGFVIRATPGNVGIFQGLYAAAAVALGFDRSAAIAVAILIQAQQVLPVTAIGVALAPEFIFKRRSPATDPRAPLDRPDAEATVGRK